MAQNPSFPDAVTSRAANALGQIRRAPARLRHPFETLRHEIDRLLHDFDHAWASPALENIFATHWPEPVLSMVNLAVDIVETDDAYELRAELPGLEKNDIEVTVANGILRLKGEKHDQKGGKTKGYHLHERHFGAFERSFRIPDGVDAAKIEATFGSGVLIILMPRSAEPRVPERKVELKAAKD